MKKKLFILVLAICLILPASFCFGGCVNSTYKIDVSCNNSNWGTVYGSGDYAPGTNIVIAAEPKDGYVFNRWSDGVDEPIRSINVDQNTSYYAIFSLVSEKYALHSVSVYLTGSIPSSVETIILKSFNIYKSSDLSNIFYFDLYNSGYLTGSSFDDDGIVIYKAETYRYKQYTKSSPLTLYVKRDANNEFTSGIDCGLRSRFLCDYKESSGVTDTNVSEGSSARLSLTTTNTMTISYNNFSLAFDINFVKI